MELGSLIGLIFNVWLQFTSSRHGSFLASTLLPKSVMCLSADVTKRDAVIWQLGGWSLNSFLCLERRVSNDNFPTGAGGNQTGASGRR
jgi:hypothetical protein